MTNILQQAAARKAQNLATGTQDSAERKEENKQEEKKEQPAAKAPKGGYKALRLQRFVKGNGSTILPVDGYFVPEDQEEYDMLEHYALNEALVEAPAADKKL